jgi:V8-like Glu-specific endopeptidase
MNKWNQILFLVLILSGPFLFVSCSQRDSKINTSSAGATHSKIINGQMVTDSDLFLKHTVGIYNRGETVCTAVIISKNTVLTAAHCVGDMRKGKVSFGTYKNKLQFREIIKYIQHPEYDESIIGIVDQPANDVMIAKFKGDLPFGYEPAEISDQDLVQNEIEVIVSGYGRDEDDEYDVLKKATVKVVEAATHEFRTEEKKKGSCDGDSGGPVFLKENESKYILVGSISRGDQNCNSYGIYENMTYYKHWINNSVSALEGPR